MKHMCKKAVSRIRSSPQGTRVILGDGYVTRNSDLTLGDTVELEILDGDRTIEKKSLKLWRW